MLMMLGPALFEIQPMNLTKVKEGQKFPFASHEVLGAQPLLENMGIDSSTVELKGNLKPEHFGGLNELESLRSAQRAGVPLPLVRGDFTPLGFFVIEEMEVEHEILNELGIGREVEIEIKLKSVSTPDVGMASAIFRLFG